ncbi:MAG TPA: ABC transporter ATP-binding protein [Syntrophomonadaceae bacterium]|nr:ABC transporter ATP-binding protein [Syntrophomonadaceae bacterium]HQA06630.1 ABC transporter ATP-binding protein [Syntrophomonadaceae bacterium]HQE22297.1 ABC transporter ATP-binding protein [Syntrophomonadaceae bacterium]
MIRAENISKRFSSIQALDRVSLQVNQQDIFGLIGPDGAGKTTLMRIICGLMSQDEGQVRLMDQAPELIDRQNLGYMPQRFSLYPDLTIQENIEFFGSLYSLPKQVIRNRAKEILEITGLSPFTNRLAGSLSGGMKQKLALTCALITRPALLVLDEPTYGVDPQSRQEFWRILYQLNHQGMTIMVSTPYMDEAELCTRVAFINQGHILACDTPQNLKKPFSQRVLEVRTPCQDPRLFDNLEEVEDASFFGYKYRLVVSDGPQGQQAIRSYLAAQGLDGIIEPVSPAMEDLFVIMTGKDD